MSYLNWRSITQLLLGIVPDICKAVEIRIRHDVAASIMGIAHDHPFYEVMNTSIAFSTFGRQGCGQEDFEANDPTK